MLVCRLIDGGPRVAIFFRVVAVRSVCRSLGPQLAHAQGYGDRSVLRKLEPTAQAKLHRLHRLPPKSRAGPALPRFRSGTLIWVAICAAYRWIEEPQNYNLAGRSNGFQLPTSAGERNSVQNMLAARISVEGASEDRLNQSFPGGRLTAAAAGCVPDLGLRCAFAGVGRSDGDAVGSR